MANGGPTKAQLVAASVEIVLFGLISYFGIKWLAGVLDPTNKQKKAAKKQAEKIMKCLGIDPSVEMSDYEMSIAALLVDPLDVPISWRDIGGLSNIISEIKECVILPFKNKQLFQNSKLLSAPKGVLLYGPPGCGKTMIAKATAREAGCRFINLEVSSLTDKWYGESQKLASAVFSLALKLQPCIIFIDEVDSFLRSRNTHDHEATAMMKAQFMSLWDGLISAQSVDVIIMAATNRPHDVDRAILRRMPCRFHIDLPDKQQRTDILKIIIQNEKLCEDVELDALADITEGYSGSDIKEFCRVAALQRLRSQIRDIEDDNNSITSIVGGESGDMELQPIRMQDFTEAVIRMQENQVVLSTPNS